MNGIVKSIICAMGRNRAIGRGGRLPWHLPGDLCRFKQLTMGHALVMGRKTHESIGRALPGRVNIVLTRNAAYSAPDCRVCFRLADALRDAERVEMRHAPSEREVFVIGGGEVFAEALPVVDRLYLTLVDDAPTDADAFFPDCAEFGVERVRQSVRCGRWACEYVVLERSPEQGDPER